MYSNFRLVNFIFAHKILEIKNKCDNFNLNNFIGIPLHGNGRKADCQPTYNNTIQHGCSEPIIALDLFENMFLYSTST